MGLCDVSEELREAVKIAQTTCDTYPGLPNGKQCLGWGVRPLSVFTSSLLSLSRRSSHHRLLFLSLTLFLFGQLQDVGGLLGYYKGGATARFFSYVLYTEEHQTGVTVVINAGTVKPRNIAQDVLSLLRQNSR